ncbi:MAG: hypothetical protein ACLVF9_06370 [Enterocloster sp.]
MSYRLVIDGNSVYEIDEDFERYRENRMGSGNGKRSRKPEEKARKETEREDKRETGSR